MHFQRKRGCGLHRHGAHSRLLSFPGHAVIPKYYHVPADFVEAEQNKHGSQKRFPSNSGRDGKMFLWGQALFNIAKLLGVFVADTCHLKAIFFFDLLLHIIRVNIYRFCIIYDYLVILITVIVTQCSKFKDAVGIYY